MSGVIIDLIDQQVINPAWCQECGSCAAICYGDAIQLDEFIADEMEILRYENREYGRTIDENLT